MPRLSSPVIKVAIDKRPESFPEYSDDDGIQIMKDQKVKQEKNI